MPQRLSGGSRSGAWVRAVPALLVAALLVLLGLLFGLVVLGLALLAGLVLGARIWWLRRRLRKRVGAAGGTVIDAEYRVVARDREDRG